jgi:hypothetical protein
MKAGFPWVLPILLAGAAALTGGIALALLGRRMKSPAADKILSFRGGNLRSFSFLINENCQRLKQISPRLLRGLERSLLCLAGGTALGFSARLAAREPLSFGMPRARVIALGGFLMEDPRLSSSGRGMGRLS